MGYGRHVYTTRMHTIQYDTLFFMLLFEKYDGKMIGMSILLTDMIFFVDDETYS
jgi:hypothetical protein